jgi:hypothetical protein
MKQTTLQRARTAKAAVLREFRKLPNLVGIGIIRCPEGYCVKVNLSEPMPPGTSLPAQVAGVPVAIEVTGTITKRVIAKR